MTIYRWGSRSLGHRSRVVVPLRFLMDETLSMSPWDLALTDSSRDLETQRRNFESGASQTMDSLHLVSEKEPLSRAIHVDPYPVDYQDWKHYYALHGVVMSAALRLGMDLSWIRWGGNWDQDEDFSDQKFNDLAHYEWRGPY